MNIRSFFINCLLLMVLPVAVFAQRTIKGRVVDAANSEPLPFVAVTVKGTTIGSTTNIDGYYSLKITESAPAATIEVSCVGYKLSSRPLTSIGADGIANIALTAEVSEINEVAVSAKSMLPQNIMRKAITNISSNYAQGPLVLDVEYSDEKTIGKAKQTRTAWVQVLDKTGYKRASAYDNFRNINYDIISAKTNFTPRTIAEYNTNIDELLLHDIVRQSGNILDGARLGEYSIAVEGTTVHNGDSAWILNYSCDKPGLLTSGDWNASSASGKLIIAKADYAVLKYTAEVRTKRLNEVSQSLASDTAASASAIMKTVYTVETTYEQKNGTYALKQVKYSCPDAKRTSSLHIVSSNNGGVLPIAGREFLAKIPDPKKK